MRVWQPGRLGASPRTVRETVLAGLSTQIARARQLFELALQQNLLVAPLIEVTPNNRFFEYFGFHDEWLRQQQGLAVGNGNAGSPSTR